MSSPTKLNVVTSDWKGSENVPTPQKSSAPQALSYEKPPSPKKHTLRKAASTTTADRFIPSRCLSFVKVAADLQAPPQPTDSPSKHIAFQSSRIYQHSVAQVCGVAPQKILQYAPAPPERRHQHSFLLGAATLNEGLTDVLQTSRRCNSGGIVPTHALERSRNVPAVPGRILDAPGLIDDYYLNLLAWSCDNLLAVALSTSVYIWQAGVGAVSLLTTCDCPVTSVAWSDDGSFLSVGKENGLVEVWDIEDSTKLRTMTASPSRVAAHAWSRHLVTTGSRGGAMRHNDVRVAQHVVGELSGHTAEVCGISWRSDGGQLATGGNDNVVNIWDARANVPLHSKTAHTAAVKALSWCDYRLSLLASGGGTNDKHIHFWNTSTGARVNSINTGSQVTSLNWGHAKGTGLEIVATGGYPNNSISMYHYPTLQKTGEIGNSHDGRILNSALSPDGTVLATAAADENLKFWKVFDLAKSHMSGKDADSALTNGGKQIRRVMTIR